MNSPYDVFKDKTILMSHDFRRAGADGKAANYMPSDCLVMFSGGPGFYYFTQGEFSKALHWFEQELDVVFEAEKSEGRRLHKGGYYFQMAMAGKNLGLVGTYDHYMELAKEEDRLSYGDTAAEFPATSLV